MRLAVLLVVTAVALVGFTSAAGVDPTPQQQITKLKQQLRNARLANADLRLERDDQDAVLADQAAQITRLQGRLANPPDPLDQILARNPDGLWAAMVAIWRAFPTLSPSALCGYDRSSQPGDPAGLSVTSYTFARWAGC